MNSNNENPNAETVEKIRAHREARTEALKACYRHGNLLDNSATVLARLILTAIAEGVSTIEEEQRAVCKRFPLLTASGKPSKTPNGKFKASWDKIVLLQTVRDGTNKTFVRPEAVAIVERFMAEGSTMTLNEAWEAIRADKAGADAEARAAITDEEKAERKAQEQTETEEAFAGAVANSPAMLLALAREINAYTVEEHGGFADALQAVRTAIDGFAERLSASETEQQQQAA